jgi:hypothetical protein
VDRLNPPASRRRASNAWQREWLQQFKLDQSPELDLCLISISSKIFLHIFISAFNRGIFHHLLARHGTGFPYI